MECLNNLFTSEKNSYFGGDVIVSFLPVYVIPNKKKMLNGISRFEISLLSLFFYEPFTEYLPS